MHHLGYALRVFMAVYTVHEPPPKRFEQASDPERFDFVRDGFSFSAFVFGPLWMLWHRMWLVLLGYIGVSAGVELFVSVLGTAGAPTLVAGFPFAASRGNAAARSAVSRFLPRCSR